MSKIVANIGVIGSGKDYNSDLLLKKSKKGVKLGFSDGIREYTWRFLNWRPENDFEYRRFKELYISSPVFGYIQGRDLLKNIGMFMRELDPHYWAKYTSLNAMNYLDQGYDVFISDLRFDEEASYVFSIKEEKNVDVQFIFRDYKSQHYEINEHASEKFAQYFLQLGCKDGQDITELVKQKLNLNNDAK